jgi:hypothetical protein
VHEQLRGAAQHLSLRFLAHHIAERRVALTLPNAAAWLKPGNYLGEFDTPGRFFPSS